MPGASNGGLHRTGIVANDGAVSPLELSVAAAVAFLGAGVAAVAGFGGAVLLLPVFTWVFGPQLAVPVLTITQLFSNGGRVWLNRREIKKPMVGWFALGAVPFAVAGALVFASAPLAALTRVFGAFLLLAVVARRLLKKAPAPSARSFAVVGAISGFGSAIVGSTGPLTGPFFLSAGLLRGAYIGTEAASALVMHFTKLAAYGATSVLTPDAVLAGLLLAPPTLAGAWTGKRVIAYLPERGFVVLVEIALVTSGMLLLIRG